MMRFGLPPTLDRPTGLRTVLVLCLALFGRSACGDEGRARKVTAPWKDSRLEVRRDLRDKFHPWTPPATREQWDTERQKIREQLLIATGLWPMPDLSPLQPQIFGRIEKSDYTVERVVIETLPGLLVTGNLYRPANTQPGQRHPGILSPHGHWSNGRFYDAGEKTAKQQLDSQAESIESAARFPLQARMVHLARMGCVVFHYDMIGYADSKLLDHRTGFSDAKSALWLQNLMGLQTLNSIRALDFIATLPDVDPQRIGVTGASGGGTQTFVLCAIDPRPAAAFPAVMVSTDMQGGCVCENAPYLRLGLNNVAFAAVFAPRPMALSGADDWTIKIETKGLPELKSVYQLYGQPQLVHARCDPQFGHNYNSVSRAMMYEWFHSHLGLDGDLPTERDFEPLTVEQMSIHADFKTELSSEEALQAVKSRLTTASISSWNRLEQLAENRPTEAMRRYRELIQPVLRVTLGAQADSVVYFSQQTTEGDRLRAMTGVAGREKPVDTAATDAIPFRVDLPEEFQGSVVILLHEDGVEAARSEPLHQELLKANCAVLTGELLGESENRRPPINEQFYGYTLGYNRSLISERVRDIAVLVSLAHQHQAVQQVHLVGEGRAAVWALLAAAALGDQITSVSGNLSQFDFDQVSRINDPEFLPGALRYGGVGGLCGLAGESRVLLGEWPDRPGSGSDWALKLTATEAQQPLRVEADRVSEDEIVEWIQSDGR